MMLRDTLAIGTAIPRVGRILTRREHGMERAIATLEFEDGATCLVQVTGPPNPLPPSPPRDPKHFTMFDGDWDEERTTRVEGRNTLRPSVTR